MDSIRIHERDNGACNPLIRWGKRIPCVVVVMPYNEHINPEPTRSSSMATKLSDREVLAIRQSLANGVTRKALQELYDVSLETIARIARGDTRAGVMKVDVKREERLDEEIAASAERLQSLLAETGK